MIRSPFFQKVLPSIHLRWSHCLVCCKQPLFATDCLWTAITLVVRQYTLYGMLDCPAIKWNKRNNTEWPHKILSIIVWMKTLNFYRNDSFKTFSGDILSQSITHKGIISWWFRWTALMRGKLISVKFNIDTPNLNIWTISLKGYQNY